MFYLPIFGAFLEAVDIIITKKVLKKRDTCLARIIAISHRGDQPKIGLTMRQPGLGKLEWVEEEKKRAKMGAKKYEEKTEKRSGKKTKKEE